jgi:hypothetical protein
MAGRGMGAASRGGGAVAKGPKNKVVSEPSMKTPKVLMMAKGGDVNVNQHKRMAMGMMGGGAVRKYKRGGPVLPADRSTGYSGRPINIATSGPAARSALYKMATAASLAPGGIGKAAKAALIGSQMYPSVKDSAQAFYDEFTSRSPDSEEILKESQGPAQYRRGGEVRRKMRKGGMADKKGRAMKRKSFDARGRAMKGR